MKLIIANKLYSSWSLRPWMLMTALGIPFEETVIPMYFPDSKARMLDVSPTGKMPCLVDGEVTIWESLAIMEYLHERFPEQGRVASRCEGARARPRGGQRDARRLPGTAQCLPDESRQALCTARPRLGRCRQRTPARRPVVADARRRFGAGGAFLYGDFGAADAMYAPVVTRLDTYQIPVIIGDAPLHGCRPRASRRSCNGATAALAEPWTIDHYEEGWTAVETFHAGAQRTNHPRHPA